MFETALVALDLSPAERPIVDCLPELKRWGTKKVVLTHVIKVAYAQGAGYGHEDEYKAWLEKNAAPLKAAGLEVAVVVRAAGVPAAEIFGVARESKADLIVVGSRGQNMVRKLFLGSVAREVIRKATLPVLLQWMEPTANATKARCEAVCKNMLEHVLLATDLSKHAGAAEAAAVALARVAARTDCLTVLTPEALKTPTALPMSEAALDAILDRITKSGGNGEALVADGEPVKTIARIARERECSLLVVGKHGQNRSAGVLIGSTAARLCEIAGRPVLMVPSA
ncbi:MAG TPA: universal stress protein [Burkholderiales bacterium]|nr:universal stress protein [Burkholderiales bacterium]